MARDYHGVTMRLANGFGLGFWRKARLAADQVASAHLYPTENTLVVHIGDSLTFTRETHVLTQTTSLDWGGALAVIVKTDEASHNAEAIRQRAALAPDTNGLIADEPNWFPVGGAAVFTGTNSTADALDCMFLHHLNISSAWTLLWAGLSGHPLSLTGWVGGGLSSPVVSSPDVAVWARLNNDGDVSANSPVGSFVSAAPAAGNYNVSTVSLPSTWTSSSNKIEAAWVLEPSSSTTLNESVAASSILVTRTDQPGLIYCNLGVSGASIDQFITDAYWPTEWIEFLASLGYQIIVWYDCGTETDPAFVTKLATFTTLWQTLVPTVKFVFLTGQDRGSSPATEPYSNAQWVCYQRAKALNDVAADTALVLDLNATGLRYTQAVAAGYYDGVDPIHFTSSGYDAYFALVNTLFVRAYQSGSHCAFIVEDLEDPILQVGVEETIHVRGLVPGDRVRLTVGGVEAGTAIIASDQTATITFTPTVAMVGAVNVVLSIDGTNFTSTRPTTVAVAGSLPLLNLLEELHKGSGITPGSDGGDTTVASWVGTVAGWDFTNATAAQQPRLIDGVPTFQGNQTTVVHALSKSGTMGTHTSHTIAGVVEALIPSATTYDFLLEFSGYSAPTGTTFCELGSWTSADHWGYGYPSGGEATTADFPSGLQTFVLRLNAATGVSHLYLDGVLVHTGSYNAALGTYGCTLGTSQSKTISRGIAGKLHGLVFYNAAVSDAKVTAITSYLQAEHT